MAVERASAGTSIVDVLDRVLDKGVVIDAWVRVSLVGIDLLTVEARVVVASIETYLKYSEAVDIEAGRLVGVTGLGVDAETAARFSVGLDDASHPLVAAVRGARPVVL